MTTMQARASHRATATKEAAMTGQPNVKRSKQRRAALFVSAGMLGALMLIAVSVYAFGLRVNRTPSLPFGLYAASTATDAPMVSFCAPPLTNGESLHARGYTSAGVCDDGGAPLLKPIVARPGDTVNVSGVGLTVNGTLVLNTAALLLDGQGRALHPYPAGTYTVEPGTVWVASSYNAGSFDSRYFGPVADALIREKVAPVWIAADSKVR
jgi:conjugative transfer signal peptidase TraF